MPRLFLVPALCLLLSGPQPASPAPPTIPQPAVTKSASRNQDVVRRLYAEVLNQRRFELLPTLIAPDYTGPDGQRGPAALAGPFQALLRGFPDMRWEVQELLSEGSTVAVRWLVRGTHTGPFQHVAPTGQTVASPGMAVFTLHNGLITQAQVLTDRLGFLQQLGALPAQLPPVPADGAQVHFIDQFFVPAAAKPEFYQRMRLNRGFIKTLPGFVADAAYEHLDAEGNLRCLTVATWASRAAVDAAKVAVQAEYQRQGFAPAAMFQRLGIRLERAEYRAVAASH